MRRKGQWFIISAVIASATFLSLSLLFKGYFSVDSSAVARQDEGFFFSNVVSQLAKTMEYPSSQAEFERDVQDFICYSQKEALKKGYLLEIENTSALLQTGTQFEISLYSTYFNITRNVMLP